MPRPPEDILQVPDSLRRWLNHPGLRRGALWLALGILVAGLVLSVRAQPDALTALDWRPLAALLLLVIPVVKLLNVFEYMLSGRLLGKSIGLMEGLEVTTIGAAANMLPLPGSTLVRMAGLKAAGAGYGKGAAAVLLASLIWLAVASLYAGLWIASLGSATPAARWVGPAFVAVGALLLVLCLVVAMRLEGGCRTLGLIAANRLVLVVIEALRFVLVLQAMGVAVSFAQASGLAVTGVLGSAVSIVPAGLGVRELVAAGLGPVVGISAAAGFLAAGIIRLLDLIFILALAGVLVLRRQFGHKRAGSEAGAT